MEMPLHKPAEDRDLLNCGVWPPAINEYITVLFEDLYYVEIVQELEQSSETVLCRFMKRHFPDSSLYWSWPLEDDGFSVHKACVLPIRPSLDICLKYSNSRKIVYTLQNK